MSWQPGSSKVVTTCGLMLRCEGKKTRCGSASFHKLDIIQQNMRVSLFLGCLQATPSISEAALVDPDMAVAPSLDLRQMGLNAAGVWKVHI